MKLNDIQNTILKWASSHHKSTGAVGEHVFDALGRTVSDKEFSAALLELHSNGLGACRTLRS